MVVVSTEPSLSRSAFATVLREGGVTGTTGAARPYDVSIEAKVSPMQLSNRSNDANSRLLNHQRDLQRFEGWGRSCGEVLWGNCHDSCTSRCGWIK